MSPQRYRDLDDSIDPAFTEDEIREGWHVCPHQCDLIVGPPMEDEWEICKTNGCPATIAKA